MKKLFRKYDKLEEPYRCLTFITLLSPIVFFPSITPFWLISLICLRAYSLISD